MKARILAAFLLAAGLLCGAAPLRAQPVGVGAAFTLVAHYDLDAAAYIFCNTTGVNNLVSGSARPGLNRVKTSGSSTTITSAVTSSGSMQGLAVGDILYFTERNPVASVSTASLFGIVEQRVVEAAASADSITVNAAIDLSNGAFYTWRKLVCGTADSSGAFPVDDWGTITFQIILAQENSASTDHKIQCRNRGPAQAWSDISGPTNNTTTYNSIVSTTIHFGECRVGAQVNTDDGGDTGVNAERLTILVSGMR